MLQICVRRKQHWQQVTPQRQVSIAELTILHCTFWSLYKEHLKSFI